MADDPSTARCFENMAEVLFQERKWERSAKHFGAADAIRESCDFPRQDAEAAHVGAIVDQLKAAVANETFQTWYNAGRDLSIEEA
jgi:hypothetical protein